MNTNAIAIDNFRALLGGRIFGATFRKDDGSLRSGTFRLDVSKGVQEFGSGQRLATARGNLIVYDMHARGFRTIKLARLLSVRFAGTEVELCEECNGPDANGEPLRLCGERSLCIECESHADAMRALTWADVAGI